MLSVHYRCWRRYLRTTYIRPLLLTAVEWYWRRSKFRQLSAQIPLCDAHLSKARSDFDCHGETSSRSCIGYQGHYNCYSKYQQIILLQSITVHVNLPKIGRWKWSVETGLYCAQRSVARCIERSLQRIWHVDTCQHSWWVNANNWRKREEK